MYTKAILHSYLTAALGVYAEACELLRSASVINKRRSG